MQTLKALLAQHGWKMLLSGAMMLFAAVNEGAKQATGTSPIPPGWEHTLLLTAIGLGIIGDADKQNKLRRTLQDLGTFWRDAQPVFRDVQALTQDAKDLFPKKS